jgi:hypothetical protein
MAYEGLVRALAELPVEPRRPTLIEGTRRKVEKLSREVAVLTAVVAELIAVPTAPTKRPRGPEAKKQVMAAEKLLKHVSDRPELICSIIAEWWRRNVPPAIWQSPVFRAAWSESCGPWPENDGLGSDEALRSLLGGCSRTTARAARAVVHAAVTIVWDIDGGRVSVEALRQYTDPAIAARYGLDERRVRVLRRLCPSFLSKTGTKKTV